MRAVGEYTVLETVGDQSLTVDVTISDPLISVKITSFEFGVSATGAAKRAYPDEFNFTLGRDLAFARALGRLARKIEKQIIRATELDEVEGAT